MIASLLSPSIAQHCVSPFCISHAVPTLRKTLKNLHDHAQLDQHKQLIMSEKGQAAVQQTQQG
jgi:hypothetical protein